MKKLPVGIQSFGKIRSDDYVYADKTEYIYSLIREGEYFFLSRPRRFGKSLLVDTMKELFEGNRELFRGLWIDSSDYDFKKYPVIRLDFTQGSVLTPQKLEQTVLSQLVTISEKYDVSLRSDDPADAFMWLIQDLKKKYSEQVVVLIDEYDKPIIDHLTEPKKAKANREVLSGIYGILKGQDANLRFFS